MKICVAGQGAFGQKHLDALKRIPGVEVSSLVGGSAASTAEVAKKYGISHHTLDLAEGIQRADAVILATYARAVEQGFESLGPGELDHYLRTTGPYPVERVHRRPLLPTPTTTPSSPRWSPKGSTSPVSCTSGDNPPPTNAPPCSFSWPKILLVTDLFASWQPACKASRNGKNSWRGACLGMS